MLQIHSYLTFNGNCREAMIFYNACLGGELIMKTIGESPMADKMPARMKECILHSTIIKENVVLMGTDIVPKGGLVKGNKISMMLNCGSENEIKKCYESLSAGGKKDHPLEDTFWGALFGGLTDKYGNHWLLNYDKRNQSNQLYKNNKQ